ncbi:transmembrane amino acid transporter protein-domain-containing protein [Mucor mucedo]|uniref:transmembrane amino acid transporter protein-domain-containing protein n=1 Tax=Mucor mucedo TaxID=29922 RepID=UPI00221E4640|nr:transmembrane amino acid transporter protein-domain-containing protein [Mucor mucedo]KAI7890189.1 transmembrane amino acid transporter protein-domain-containing protein [Mucor mucedo]
MDYSEKKSSYQPSDKNVSIEQEFEYANEGIIDINREHAGSTKMAYFNIVCVVAGTGALGLPAALKQGGWIGLFILGLSWLMSVYTGIILIRCLYANGKARLSTYKEVATSAFGQVGGWVTFFFNVIILVGGPILYMVLAGTNLNQLCEGTVAEIGHVPWTIILCAVVAIPFILVKTMKEVAWMSAFGALATIVVILIVLIMAAIDRPNQINIHHDPVIWPMFPIALSTISFSFGGNIIYSHVEASMKNPRDWTKVVTAGLSTCAAMYLIVAVAGYLVYGDKVENPIYNTIPKGAAQIICIVVITIHVMMATPILTTSLSLDIEEMCNITVERFGRTKEFLIRAAIRIGIIVFVAVIACVVPHFGELMSLLGAFANCTLIFIFPVVFYLKLTGVRNKPWYELAWCFLVVLMGLVGLIFGTIEAVKELIVAYQ